jgi:hypothetical protein
MFVLYFTEGSGRNGFQKKSNPVIGHVILHNKLKYWTSRDRSIHYHQGKYTTRPVGMGVLIIIK